MKLISLIALMLLYIPLFAADDEQIADNTSGQKQLPVYVAELSNLNDYSVFANGGWDGSWYVGFNTCWIEALPAPKKGEYRKVFVGAKLGRMKTRSVTGKPVWEKEAIPGDIYIAVSSTPAWKSGQGYFLTSSADIPLESDPENALEGVGESRWFWAEVPIENVDFNNDNFVALWSPSQYFVSTASSPVLAGGWGSQKQNSWLNNDVRGYPPINPLQSLKTGITVFEPAIAMKFIPKGTEAEIKVSIEGIEEGRNKTSNKTIIASVSGNEIEKAWLEMSQDGKTWKKLSRYCYSSPYMFTLKADSLPSGSIKIRCAASDIWENTGTSQPIEMSITR